MPGKARPSAASSSSPGEDVEQPDLTQALKKYGVAASETTPLVAAESGPVSLKEPLRWLRKLSSTYSWKLLTMVFCTNHLLKGFVAGGGDEGLVGKPIEFIFGAMNISASRLQVLKAAAIAPWALKPVIAILSDAVPLWGYKKMPYVVITTVTSCFAVLALGLGMVTSEAGVVAALFLVFLHVSSVDLLVEARQSQEVKLKSSQGPEFFTFTWLGINVGQIAGVGLVGMLLHHFGHRVPYLVAAPFIALVLIPTLGNFLGETRLPPNERGVNFGLIKKHPCLVLMTLMIGALIVFLIVGTFHMDEGPLIAIALCSAVIVFSCFSFFIRKEIAGPVLFYFLLGMTSFNIDGALFYFYTDSAMVYPEGPHFSTFFYTTGVGIVVFGGIMTGFTTGGALFKSWSYRGIIGLTIMLRVCTQLALVPVLLRWTMRAGISDKAWVLFITFFDTMFFAWRWIPKQVMGAHLTPEGVEATVLGLTAGTNNMAMILSSYCGGYMLHLMGVKPSGMPGESTMFASLWRVQVLSAVAPMAMLLLLPVLIPAKTQTEPLITEAKDSATYNSMFERLRGVRS